MHCPQCGMMNPPGADGCDCGFRVAAVASPAGARVSIAPVSSGEQSLTLRLSPIKFLLKFGVIPLPVAAAIALKPALWQNAEDWLKLTVSGIAALLVIISVVMPKFYYLHFAAEGLTMQYIGDRRFFSWNEIYDFGIVNHFINFFPLGRSITFKLREDSPQRTGLHRLISAVLPYDVSIAAMFGRSAPEIVDLLGEWQRRYSRAGSRYRASSQIS